MISIVTVVLNGAKDIEKTMMSVLDQKYKNFEYIIKDGDSKDRTNEIIKKVSYRTKSNIKHIIKKDRSVYDAMNQALDYCSGEWIIYLNAGDVFYNNNVLNIFLNLDIEKYDVIYGNTIMRDISGDSLFLGDMKLIKKRTPYCHQSCFVRYEVLSNFKFNINYKILADYDLIIRMYKNDIKFLYVNKIISIYNLDGISSTDFLSLLKERTDIHEIHGYGKGKKSFFFFCKYIEAILKLLLNRFTPKRLNIKLRRFYKKNIKKYKIIK